MMKLLILILFISSAWADITIPLDSEVMQKYGEPSIAEVSSSKEINILVWNLYKGSHENFHEVFSKEIPDNDIILMQEVNLDEQSLNIFDSFNEFETKVSQSFINDGIGTGVGIMSKFMTSSSEWIRSNANEPIVGTPKMIQINKYKLKDDNFLMVVNVHGINFVRFNSFKSQFESLKEVFDSHQGPIVFAGDFNTWSKKRMNYIKNLTQNYDLKAVKFENDHLRKRFFGKALDHVFTKGLNVVGAVVKKMKDVSDHTALKLKALIKSNKERHVSIY